jgi:hypothetical protein
MMQQLVQQKQRPDHVQLEEAKTKLTEAVRLLYIKSSVNTTRNLQLSIQHNNDTK